VGDDALACERIVIGALEEELFGVRIVDELGSVTYELGSKIRAGEARKPERACGHGRIGTPDHLEFEVGDNLW
jgi:hypothetical protein